LYYIGLPVVAYLLGSIPFGLIFTRLFTSTDIRSSGSGNIGATNVARTAGKLLGAATLAGDMLKGAVPVWIAVALAGKQGDWPEFFVSLVAFSSFAGHLFPLYMRFKGGGKGVATAAGCFFVISPVAGVVAVLMFTLMICLTRRVSVGSLSAAAILPLAMWKSTQSDLFTGCAGVVALAIFLRHRENIARLAKGEEPRLES